MSPGVSGDIALVKLDKPVAYTGRGKILVKHAFWKIENYIKVTNIYLKYYFAYVFFTVLKCHRSVFLGDKPKILLRV